MKTILLILALALFARAQNAGYQAIDIAEAQSSTEIQTLLQFGLQTILQDATSLGYFNNTDFTVQTINSISEQVADSGDYLFDVVYSDPSGITITANFEANYDVALNSISIVSYSYGVSYPAVDPSGSAPAETWSKVSVSSFNSNQQLQALFQFGLAQVITNGIANASIPNTTFVSAVISAIESQSVDNGEVYRFTCNATDGQGTTLTLVFDALNQLSSSVYNVTFTPLPPVDNSTNSTNPDTGSEESGEGTTPEEESGEGNNEETTVPIDPIGPSDNSTNTTAPSNNSTNATEPDNVEIVSGLPYTLLDVDTALESSLANVLLKYGYQSVAKLGVNQGKLQNTTYSLLNVDKVGQYNFTNGVAYLFAVNLIGDNRHILVDANYTVYFRYSNKSAKLTAYYYNYTIFRNEIPVGNETNTTIPDTNTTNPDTNTTTGSNSTNTTVPDNSTTAPVSLYAQIQQDALLNSVFSYGVDQVLASGIAKGKIVNTNYNVTDVFNYNRTNGTSTTNFRFETRLANANGSIVVFANFTVQYKSKDQSMKLTAFSYNSTVIKIVPNIPNNTNTTTGNNTNNTNTTVPDSGNNGTSTNTTVPDSGNNSTDTNTTVPDAGNNSTDTNTTAPDAGNSTTNSTDNSTSNTYVAVDPSEIASSQEIQSVLSYGTQQILQVGLQAGKIPSANYTISEVVSVSELTQNGGNSYQCQVNLDGDNGVEVKTTFTAFYNSTSQATSLSKYSYAVLNIPVA